MTLFQSSVDLGVLFVATLGWCLEIFHLHIIVGTLVVTYTLGFMFLLETPVYLVRNGESEKAEKSMRIVRGSNMIREVKFVNCNKLLRKL